MWAPFGHHFTENNAFHQDMEKAAKPSNHAALRPFSVHIKHVENDTKIYYFLYQYYKMRTVRLQERTFKWDRHLTVL